MAKYGENVVIDGAEVVIANTLDLSEVSMTEMAGGDFGTFYNVGGATSYNQLADKPSINGHTVVGDKSGEDYKLQDKMQFLTVQEIEKILYLP